MDFLKCVSQPPTSTYHDKLPHYLLPGLNVQKNTCEKHFDEHNQLFPYKCSYGKIFQPPCVPKGVREGQDPITKLVIEKTQWKTNSEKLVNRLRRSAEARVKFEALRGRVLCGVDEVVVPRNEQRLLKHFKKDPDPYFDGVYNWYYCGGTLSTATYHDKGYVISAQGRYLDDLCTVPLVKVNNSLGTYVSTKCNKKQPIYQIKSAIIAGKVAVGVRQRDTIHLYLNKNNTNSLILKKNTKFVAYDGKPFTGLDLNPLLGQLCSSTCDREIKLWDLNQQAYVLTGNVAPNLVCTTHEKRENGWCGVTYRSEFEIFVTDKCCFTWIDTRCDLNNPVKGFCLKAEGKNFLDLSCEEMSCLLYTKQRNIYIGSTHSVMQYEPRTSFSTPVRCWTHQLSSPPFLAQSTNLGNMKELLCIGDHKQLMCIIAGKICCSSYPPLSLPAASKSQGIMGLSELQEYFNDETKFLMQTTSGHIYKQIFKSGSNEVLNNEPPQSEVFHKKRLYASSLKNMKPIYEYLKETVDLVKVNEDKNPPPLQQKWQMSKAELESYVDLLSPIILEAWDIEDMEEWSKDEHNLPSPSIADKVEQWLQNVDFSVIRHPVSNSQETSTDINKTTDCSYKNVNMSLSQDIFENQPSQVSVVSEYNNSCESPPKRSAISLERKSKKQKLSSVDGFYEYYDLTLQSTQETNDKSVKIVSNKFTKNKKRVNVSGF